MNDFIRPGEVTRAGAGFDAQAHAEAIRARCIAIVASAPRQPASERYVISSMQAMLYLLKKSGMPRWLVESFTRRDPAEIAAALRAVNEARRAEPQLAGWLDRMAAAMPDFNGAEPRPGQPGFART